MKKALAFVAIAGLASAASADHIFNVGSISLVGAGQPSVSFNFNTTYAGATGFTFSGDFLDNPANPTTASWASDLQMELTAPSGETYLIGGFTNPSAALWDFDGSGSNGPGTYAHDGSGAFAPANSVGSWTVKLTNDWNSASSYQVWDNIVVTLVPAPGAMALLGMGGLVATRRRRA